MIEPDVTPDATSTPDRRRRTVPAGAFALAVVVALALAVLAVVALTSEAGSGGDRDVRLAAGRFTERFLTFEHDALDAWEDEVLALSTRGFAEEVEEVRESLRRLIAEGELDAETQVVDVFVGEEERSAVGVVVIYDRTVLGEEVDRTETDRYLQLSLVRLDGEWLVDDVIDIATAGDGVTPAGPEDPASPSSTASTTSSTAPAATPTTAAG